MHRFAASQMMKEILFFHRNQIRPILINLPQYYKHFQNAFYYSNICLIGNKEKIVGIKIRQHFY
ncbi:hypothetical protein B1691_15580 [Geobacillus sp. 47C-IIb]|nr:hypothetical protein B1691_15580 [Geobacillus sp. 47C-IIb]